MVSYRLLSAADLVSLYDCFLEAFSDYQGAVFRPAGNLMQLAVAREHRRRGIGSRILAALCNGEALKVNNIDEKLIGTLAFFEANKFKIVLKQHEMLKQL